MKKISRNKGMQAQLLNQLGGGADMESLARQFGGM